MVPGDPRSLSQIPASNSLRPPADPMRGFGDDLDKLEITDVSAENPTNECMQPTVWLHGVNPEPHYEPAIGGDPKAFDLASEPCWNSLA